jgi:ATP-dependent RNA helicase RhlE
MTFKDLEIIPSILQAIKAENYTHPTPIQEQSIPILLKGKDLLGCAQTGTGKTAAFAIPILQHLCLNKEELKGKRRIKALVITPTRELALQIAESFTVYGKFTGIKNTVIFGGVKQNPQTEALRRGVDVLVATPGRLLDLISQGFITLQHINYFVLDEADQMLDMGFIHDIQKVLTLLPKKRQSLFFSATMPRAIVDLSKKILGQPERVTIKPEQTTAEKVEQSIYFVSKKSKPKLIVHLLKAESYKSVLIFTRTKYGADKIVKVLRKAKINAEAIHGNKSQGARQRALGGFKSGEINVLVATDIAARGIDVSGLALVVNFDLPNIPETYVHRIGRTGRANAGGIAFSFCDLEERAYLKDIQKLIGKEITPVLEHPFANEVEEVAVKNPEQANQKRPQKSQKKSQHTTKNLGNNFRKRRRNNSAKKSSS